MGVLSRICGRNGVELSELWDGESGLAGCRETVRRRGSARKRGTYGRFGKRLCRRNFERFGAAVGEIRWLAAGDSCRGRGAQLMVKNRWKLVLELAGTQSDQLATVGGQGRVNLDVVCSPRPQGS